MSSLVRVGLIGSQFISTIHAESLRRCPHAELVAVASPTPGNAAAFAQRWSIPRHFTDYRQMLELDELDLIVIAVEKAGSTQGWSFAMYEEAWNYGFPQELAHFVDCVRHDAPPLVTGEDGRAVLEAVLAAYRSAGTGRKVSLPLEPAAAAALKPFDLWGGVRRT